MDQDKYFIVRADRAGVFFGKIKEQADTSVTMTNVRKIHYWERAAAVEEISQNGVDGDSRLTVVVPEMKISNPIQVIPCTDQATENLKGWKVWTSK